MPVIDNLRYLSDIERNIVADVEGWSSMSLFEDDYSRLKFASLTTLL